MATKKSETQKSTTQKSEPKTKPSAKTDDFPKVYMRLRTVLDGLEIGALQYCLREETTKQRIKRAEELEAWLMPIITKLKDKPTKPHEISCAEGYYNCGGVCVPYQCPADK
ncbi:MAG TPA: hypothetical protein VF599_00570 [Pyrinomonadaceae bacterium]|jgi:hypothetical protein